ncbi:TetR/AcrR family transcriptional regulator [Trinickia violacea]|uniref:TetR/AcrR family transcriptional regulator n=1 Tax=Trinickia violacea TaxID=2571746 RepID=A0A4P8IQS9_9BURK|nr:TetR/AcrR family transcriptional regulator [Trinickia violacea]QCP50347.1 TetR/AcrR family transcriptional regulator [Trinickia violacea]
MDTDEIQERQRAGSDANKNAGRPSIREEQKQRTRDRILDAAFEIFQEVGFRAATVDEIMKRAGAGRATFYLHFKDKMEIAAGIGRRSGVVVAERFRRLDSLVAPTRADVRAWLEEDVAERRNNDVLVHVIHEAMTTDPGFGQEYLDYCGRIAQRVMVNTIARWPEERQALARSRFVCLFIMLDRVEFHMLCQGLNFGGCDPLDAVAEILWNELFGNAM